MLGGLRGIVETACVYIVMVLDLTPLTVTDTCAPALSKQVSV